MGWNGRGMGLGIRTIMQDKGWISRVRNMRFGARLGPVVLCVCAVCWVLCCVLLCVVLCCVVLCCAVLCVMCCAVYCASDALEHSCFTSRVHQSNCQTASASVSDTVRRRGGRSANRAIGPRGQSFGSEMAIILHPHVRMCSRRSNSAARIVTLEVVLVTQSETSSPSLILFSFARCFIFLIFFYLSYFLLFFPYPVFHISLLFPGLGVLAYRVGWLTRACRCHMHRATSQRANERLMLRSAKPIVIIPRRPAGRMGCRCQVGHCDGPTEPFRRVCRLPD